MASLLLRNGSVFDGVRYVGPRTVAVRDGRVVAVGDERDCRDAAGPRAEVVDVAGGLLLPGFSDAHAHPMVGGLERLHGELTGLSTAEQYLEAIRTHAEARPGDAWVRGGGWSVGVFGPHGPTAALLDTVVPDRPAFLPSSDHHDAWVNTRALEAAGVTAATPDPPDGWIERDEHGNPTGTLREAAMALVHDHVRTDRAERRDALLEAQRHLFSWGITGWHDALIGGYAGIDDPTQAYLDLLEAGELTARVRASQWWDRHRGTEQLAELRAQRDRLAAAGLDAGSVKLMLDGIAETYTAAVTEPYLDLAGCPCGDRGLAFLSPDRLREAVVALDAEGFAAHFHAIGDRAVHDALDAVEAAQAANGRLPHRHQVAHLQLVRPEDRPRFGALGVTANVEGMWVLLNSGSVQLLLPHLDPERAAWHYPFADLVAGGAHLAGGSDWPVNPPEPVAAVHALVNRSGWSADGDPGDPLCPEQALPLDVALAAYTSGSARVVASAASGRLEAGAVADLAILDRDPFTGPREEIGAARVLATYLAGRRVHG